MDTWAMALEIFGETRRFADKPTEALEAQGWLESHWEDAPCLIVAGFNEGVVPSAVAGDAFLPEQLRARLGLGTQVGRLARDAYLLQALAASRSTGGRLELLLGRAAASGEPLRPSRLLLLGEEAELPRRVRWLFRELAPEEGAGAAWSRAWKLNPPLAAPTVALPVTGFRDYLACPFRFYLRHRLGMRAIEPEKEEMDALDFGVLIHDAMEGLYREPTMRHCSVEAEVRKFLEERLADRVRERWGRRPTTPLLVQIESARQRLCQAARVHAESAAAGWVVEAVEREFRHRVGTLEVRGRIDRIDRNEATGSVRVLDYKTADAARSPREAHVRRASGRDLATAAPAGAKPFVAPDGKEYVWRDLQLPLYKWALAAEWGGAIELGYFVLPKAVSETAILIWEDFDAAWLEAAEKCAGQVAEAIGSGAFWPPMEVTRYDDDFAALFHQGAEASVQWPPQEELRR